MYLAVYSFQNYVRYIAATCVCILLSTVFNNMAVISRRSVYVSCSPQFSTLYMYQLHVYCGKKCMYLAVRLQRSVYVSCSRQFSTLCQLYRDEVCMYRAVRSFQHYTCISYMYIAAKSVCILQSAVFKIMSVILQRSVYLSCCPQLSKLCQLCCGNVCMYLAARGFKQYGSYICNEVCMYLAVGSFQQYVSYTATKCVCILQFAVFNIMSVILQRSVYLSCCPQFLTIWQLYCRQRVYVSCCLQF